MRLLGQLLNSYLLSLSLLVWLLGLLGLLRLGVFGILLLLILVVCVLVILLVVVLVLGLFGVLVVIVFEVFWLADCLIVVFFVPTIILLFGFFVCTKQKFADFGGLGCEDLACDEWVSGCLIVRELELVLFFFSAHSAFSS